jgi:hypothetical protein
VEVEAIADKGGGSMLPETQTEAFNRFYDSARFNDILDPKTTLLLHLATAMSVACYP